MNSSNKKSLFETAAEMAVRLNSLYKNTPHGRTYLLDFMDSNEWFGIVPEMKDNIPLITNDDFEKFMEPLTLWLSAYRKPGREKIELMLQYFDGVYPVTCRLYYDFIKKRRLENEASAWKLLDYLLSEIDREIIEYSESDLENLIRPMYADATLAVARMFADFLQTTEYNGRPLTKWMYDFEEREKPGFVNDAYPIQDFSVMAYYTFNEEMWAKQGLIKKAVASKTYADLWLFTALHFICALRKNDMKRLPTPALPYAGETVLKNILENMFDKRDAYALAEELSVRMKLKTMKPLKTSRYNNIPELKLFVPESLKVPLGTIMAIALSHHSEIKPGEHFFVPEGRVDWNLAQVRSFFGKDFEKALGNRRFSSLRANKSYLQGIDAVGGKDNEQGKPKGYMLAALARSHKGGIGSLAKTTDIYLKDARFNGYSPEFIICEMFERGVFSFIPALLLEMYAGDKYKMLPVRLQTKLIGEVGLTPYHIELMTYAADHALEKSRKVISSVLSETSNIHENIFGILQNIASGNAPGRCEEYLCLMTAAGLPCAFTDRDACIGCGYEIYTKAAAHMLMKEYAHLVHMKKSAKQAEDARRYEKILEMSVLPAVAEMISSAKLLYRETDITGFLDIVERGLEYADGNV